MMEIKPKIILTCDDMHPNAIPLWEEYWDKLKKKHTKIKVNTFVVPLWKGREQNDVFKNEKFTEWHEKRQKWVEVGQLGYTHDKFSECIKFEKPQYSIIRRGYRKLNSFMPNNIHAFKPPHNRMDYNTLPILQSLGFTCCIYHKTIIFLKKVEKPIEEYFIVETHINTDEKHPDNINVIYEKFERYIKELRINGYEFITIKELIEQSLICEEKEARNEILINC